MTYKFWPLFKAQWCFKEDAKYGFYMALGVSVLFSLIFHDLSHWDRISHSLQWGLIVNIVWWSFVLIFNIIACALITIAAKYTVSQKKVYGYWLGWRK